MKSKYGLSAQQRLNMTVSPSPATRPKSGRLSSSLSQSTPHLAGNPSQSQANPIKKPNNSDLNYSPRLNQSVTRRNTPSRSETPKMRRQSSVTSESSTTSARELKVRPKSSMNVTWDGDSRKERRLSSCSPLGRKSP